MGILSWLKKPKASASEEASMPGLALPALGRIVGYQAADGVGELELASGATLRFGRSACTFEPAVGLVVRLEALAPHPRGGVRAAHVTLDASQDLDDYDARVSARDHELGIASAPQRPEAAFEQAVATAEALAWVVVLLDAPLPTTTAELEAFAARLDLRGRGIDVARDPRTGDLAWRVGRHEFSTRGWANHPYPFERMDRRNVGDDFEPGQAFVGLGTGLPALGREMRAATGAPPEDSWAADGQLRALSKLVCVLLEVGTGVVLPQSGALAVDRARFTELLGELDDAACRPFGAWIDVALAGEDPVCLRSYGMLLSGLDDVAVPLADPADRWEQKRAYEALLFACHEMVHGVRDLAPGELLDVPIGASIGAYPLDPEGDAIRYRVRAGELLQLERLSMLDLGPLLRAGELHTNGYQALFLHHLEAHLPGAPVARLDAQTTAAVPHTVHVRDTGDAYLLVTNGVGLVPQPGGTAELRNQRVELVTWTDEHSPALARLVSFFGSLVHDHDGSEERVWKIADTVSFPEGEEHEGIAHFVLADAGELVLPGDVTITLLAPIPMSIHDYADTRAGGAARWLADTIGPDPSAPAVRARWRLGLP